MNKESYIVNLANYIEQVDFFEGIQQLYTNSALF